MTDRETLTTRLVYETSHRSTVTGTAPLDRDALARKALDYFGYLNPGDSDAQKLLRVTVGDTTFDATGRRLDAPSAPATASAEDQLEQVRFLLDDLRAGYPNPAPYDTASVVIERLTRILEPDGAPQ